MKTANNEHSLIENTRMKYLETSGHFFLFQLFHSWEMNVTIKNVV